MEFLNFDQLLATFLVKLPPDLQLTLSWSIIWRHSSPASWHWEAGSLRNSSLHQGKKSSYLCRVLSTGMAYKLKKIGDVNLTLKVRNPVIFSVCVYSPLQIWLYKVFYKSFQFQKKKEKCLEVNSWGPATGSSCVHYSCFHSKSNHPLPSVLRCNFVLTAFCSGSLWMCLWILPCCLLNAQLIQFKMKRSC